MPEDQAPRKQIHDAIQVSREGEALDGAVLIGWITVAEWMAPDGTRRLSRIAGGPGDDQAPPGWQTQGYLHNALHEDWTGADDWGNAS